MKGFWKALTVLLFLLCLVGGGLVAADHYGTIHFDTHPLLSVFGYGWTDIPLQVGVVNLPEGDMMIVRYTPAIQPRVGDVVLQYKSGLYGQWAAWVTSIGSDGTLQLARGEDVSSSAPPEGIPAVYVAHIPHLAWAIGWMRQPLVWAAAFLALLVVYLVYRLWPVPYYPDDDAPLSPKDADVETLLDR